MIAIQRALFIQGIDAGWRGDQPANAGKITAAYLDELINGIPRMTAPEGASSVDVDIPKLKADYVLEVNAENVVKAKEDAKDSDHATTKEDIDIQDLMGMTSQEIEDFIDINLVSMSPQVRDHFKKLTKICAVLARHVI